MDWRYVKKGGGFNYGNVIVTCETPNRCLAVDITNSKGKVLSILYLSDGKILTTMEWLMVFIEKS